MRCDSPGGHHCAQRGHNEAMDRGWRFPDAKLDGKDSFYAEIADALTPPWVKEAIQKAMALPDAAP